MDPNGKPWEENVKGDSAALPKAGIADPLTDEIEADFAEPLVSVHSK